MKFHNQGNYQHDQQHRTGILLTNLGTPESPDTKGVRKFLREFLSDPRVVEIPRPIWWLILNIVILNTRPKRSAAAYQKVWTDQGSPLMTISRQQLAGLKDAIGGDNLIVELAMRYGTPSIGAGLRKLRDQGATRVLVMPLYPQYSATTTATTFDAVASEMKQWRWIPELRFVNHYHDHARYIEALAESIESHWQQHQRAEVLLMSFHGIPEDYFHQGDPYHCHCHKTGRLLAQRLGLSDNQWQLSFQSRLGPKKWLQPYTDKTLEALAKGGTGSVQVVCPGFSVDCLETLEEIAMENRDVFISAGGKQYQYIPCLNDSAAHIEMMRTIISEHTDGWGKFDDNLEQRKQRAMALGAKS